MYIRSLRIRNLKLLKEFDLDFQRGGEPRPWTVIVGENGLCKTSILHAIALAAVGPSRTRELISAQSLADRRQDKATVEIEAEFTFSARFKGYRSYPGIKKNRPRPDGVVSSLTLPPGAPAFKGNSHYDHEPAGSQRRRIDDARDAELYLWFVAGYGVERALPPPRQMRSEEGDFTVQRLEPLFLKGPIRGTGFAELFKDPDLAQAYEALLRKVFVEGDADLLPNIESVDLGINRGVRRLKDISALHSFGYRVNGKTVQIPATWLSQGYQATISWVADLIGQVLLEAHGRVEPEKMEGIVLIDEIDLHLHPRWQRNIVRALKATFPRIQFIATTHSPMVLPYLAPDEIVVLERDGEGNVVPERREESPALLTGSGIYARYFDLDEIFPHPLGAMLFRYAFLVGNPVRTKVEQAEMESLRAELARNQIDPGWLPTGKKPRRRSR